MVRKKLFGWLPYRTGHWIYLFHALILLLVLYPYFETPAEDRHPWLLVLMNSAIVLAIIYAASWTHRHLIIALVLGLPTLIVYWLPQLPFEREIALVGTVFLYLYAILLILRNLLRAHEVTQDEIYGATSLYILLGLTWAAFYQGIEWIFPGSFHLAEVHNIDQTLNWSDFIYFSFTTLTTLGYGDIAPVTSQARSLAIIEAITGLIFVAATISGAIGIYLSRRILKLKAKLKEHQHQ